MVQSLMVQGIFVGAGNGGDNCSFKNQRFLPQVAKSGDYEIGDANSE